MDEERVEERESEGEEKQKGVEFRNNGEEEGDGEVANLYMTHAWYIYPVYIGVGVCVCLSTSLGCVF